MCANVFFFFPSFLKINLCVFSDLLCLARAAAGFGALLFPSNTRANLCLSSKTWRVKVNTSNAPELTPESEVLQSQNRFEICY